MTPIRAAAIVRGDVPGLLRRGMPVINAHRQRAVIVEAVDPAPDRLHELAAIRIDYTDPAALYLSLHWLADRGHPGCLWMLPTTHGGRVEAWDGLSAWEVAAVLVSVSVGRVARGVGPIVDIGGPWARFFTVAWIRHGVCGLRGRAFVHDTPYDGVGWGRGSDDTYDDESGDLVFYEVGGLETGDAGKLAADTAALTDGCCLQVPGGLVVPT